MSVWFNSASLEYATRSDGVHNSIPVTVSCRRFVTGSTQYYLVALGNSATGTPIIAIRATLTSLEYLIRDNSGNITTPTASAVGQTGLWDHFAGVSSSATSHQAWMNGVPGTVSTTNIPGAFDITTSSIGGLKRTGAVEQPILGAIADAAVWNCALTGAEIRLLANGVPPHMIRPANLMWYVPMEDAAYPAIDLRSGRNATIVGAPTRFAHPRVARRYFLPRRFGVTAAGAQTISPSGIASEETFGTTTITPGAVSVAPSGIASLEAFGTAVLTPGSVTVSPSGIASLEAFGTAVVTPGTVTVSPSGIASDEAFGTAVLTPGAVTVSPSGIASAEVFGDPVISAGTLTITSAGAIASAEAFGTAVLTPGAVTVLPSGIASLEAFGTCTITSASLQTISGAGGIVSAEMFGSFEVILFVGGELLTVSASDESVTAIAFDDGLVTIATVREGLTQ